MMSDNWDSYVFDSPEPGWVDVSETGWDGLKLWCAGAENRARTPRDDRDRTVRLVRESGGPRSETSEPFTANDLQIIEEGIDSYLAEAGIPALPHGYRWYLRVPEGWSGDLLDRIDSQLSPTLTGAPRPADWLRELQPIMDDLYAGDFPGTSRQI